MVPALSCREAWCVLGRPEGGAEADVGSDAAVVQDQRSTVCENERSTAGQYEEAAKAQSPKLCCRAKAWSHWSVAVMLLGIHTSSNLWHDMVHPKDLGWPGLPVWVPAPPVAGLGTTLAGLEQSKALMSMKWAPSRS